MKLIRSLKKEGKERDVELKLRMKIFGSKLIRTRRENIHDEISLREDPKSLHRRQRQSIDQLVREHRVSLSHHLQWCEWSN